MIETSISPLPAQPVFELEDFMNFSKETRISSEALGQIEDLFQKWSSLIQARKIATNKKSWLAVWMPEEVEKFIDKRWEQAPSEGFLLNMLAQYMCMTATEELVPQTSGNGCAPLPDMTIDLVRSLSELDLLNENTNTLARRYSVLTFFPFAGGCEICALKSECPKLKGSPDMLSWVIPGHEKGVQP